MSPAVPDSGHRTRLLSRPGIVVVTGFALIAISVVALAYRAERARFIALTLKNEVLPPLPDGRDRFIAPGVVTPTAIPSQTALLGDDEPVIGIEAGGKARAYSLRAMRGLTQHIINDVVGGSAVSVTYCDLSECVKAFGGEDRRDPLDISQAGLMNSRMVLQVANVCYDQETGKVVDAPPGPSPPPFPYATIPATRTTWGMEVAIPRDRCL